VSETHHTTTPSTTPDEPRSPQQVADDVVARVLARAGTALHAGGTVHSAYDGDQLDLEERTSLRRVAGLSTELEDVTEVEYRELRLEKVVLVGVWGSSSSAGTSNGTLQDAEVSLRELAALAETAGSTVLDGLLQRRAKPDPGTYLGSGKAAELASVVAAVGADTVVIDGELAPSQRRALEDIVRVKVVDRTALILDIFAQHAKSREGKAQVELAQLEYLLPRLRGWGESMSRQAGGQVGGAGAGMGSRGPGETKIELDRRRIRNRMAKLRREIAAMEPARMTKRASRKRHAIPSVAIAGYTNAGKSTLFNALTRADAYAADQLFATLDTTTRRIWVEGAGSVVVSDTVGFIRDLPHGLIAAFRATLEETVHADLLLHVVDAASPQRDEQIFEVNKVLAEIGAAAIPTILVYNKIDRAGLEPRVERDAHGTIARVFVSATERAGLDALRGAIAETGQIVGNNAANYQTLQSE